nr:DUF3450 domain-containing protein [Halomonas populi]
MLCASLASPAFAEVTLRHEAREAQQRQAELQARIDAADDATREALQELRRLERETSRLTGYNAELEPRLTRQADTLERREAALDTLESTRDALPSLKRGLIERLASWVERDMPFLIEERQARVASVESGLANPELADADQLERILAAWRAELDYGREMDAWRGYLSESDEGEARREVDYLRIGRVGFYYLSSDGREGGVWQADARRWQALDEAERREVRNALRIARDQRAPALLRLPVSQPLEEVPAPAEGHS